MIQVSLIPIKINDKKLLIDMLYEYQREIFGDNPEEYKYLDSYWQESDRYPYFIQVDSKNIGFALVNSYNLIIDGDKSIAEFYIQKDERGNGVGKEAARQIFNLFPFKWEIRQLTQNTNAHKFWLKVISEFTQDNFKEVEIKNDKWDGWAQTFDMSGNKF